MPPSVFRTKIIAAGDLFLVKLASERKFDWNSFGIIFDELSNALFRFSLRQIGAEIDGGTPPPPPVGGGKSGVPVALTGKLVFKKLVGKLCQGSWDLI